MIVGVSRCQLIPARIKRALPGGAARKLCRKAVMTCIERKERYITAAILRQDLPAEIVEAYNMIIAVAVFPI